LFILEFDFVAERHFSWVKIFELSVNLIVFSGWASIFYYFLSLNVNLYFFSGWASIFLNIFSDWASIFLLFSLAERQFNYFLWLSVNLTIFSGWAGIFTVFSGWVSIIKIYSWMSVKWATFTPIYSIWKLYMHKFINFF